MIRAADQAPFKNHKGIRQPTIKDQGRPHSLEDWRFFHGQTVITSSSSILEADSMETKSGPAATAMPARAMTAIAERSPTTVASEPMTGGPVSKPQKPMVVTVEIAGPAPIRVSRPAAPQMT